MQYDRGYPSKGLQGGGADPIFRADFKVLRGFCAMARVTVEDCIVKIPNRFDLVMMAAHRSRGISAGAPLTVDRDNDKNPVVALREIADETVELVDIHDSVIRSLQKHVENDEPEEEDTLELMAGAIMAGEEPVAAAKPDDEDAAEPSGDDVSLTGVSDEPADGAEPDPAS